VNKEILIYAGEEEFATWQRKCISMGADKEMMESVTSTHEADGRAWGSVIWVGGKDHINTVFHEVQHSLDAHFENMNLHEEEGEMRAHMAGYVNAEVFKWLTAKEGVKSETKKKSKSSTKGKQGKHPSKAKDSPTGA